MTLPRRFVLLVLPLAAGITVLFLLPKDPRLAAIEHRIFPYPERFQEPAPFTKSSDHPNDFEMNVYSLDGAPKLDLSAKAFVVDRETRDILGTSNFGEAPADPVQWAYLLEKLRATSPTRVALVTPLSWSETSELSLRALQARIGKFTKPSLGLSLAKSATPSPFPEEFKNSTITLAADSLPNLPLVNSLKDPPSATSSRYGFTLLDPAPPLFNKGELTLPLLARWRDPEGKDHVLPSLELATLLAALNLSPASVTFDPRGFLLMGDPGPILRVDSQGRTTIPAPLDPLTPTSASEILLSKDQPKSGITFLLTDREPTSLHYLPTSLQNLAAHFPTVAKAYRRPGLWLDLAILAILALSLQLTRFRMLAVAITISFAFYLAPRFYQLWLVVSPALALLAVGLLLKFLISRLKPPKKREIFLPSDS